jgi:hypothetical protein
VGRRRGRIPSAYSLRQRSARRRYSYGVAIPASCGSRRVPLQEWRTELPRLAAAAVGAKAAGGKDEITPKGRNSHAASAPLAAAAPAAEQAGLAHTPILALVARRVA